MKKIYAVFLLILAVAAAPFFSPRGTTATVKKDGSGNFTTIQAAVSFYKTNTPSGGYPLTIEVYGNPETFVEEVQIDGAFAGQGATDTVTIKEAAGQNVTVDGTTYGFRLFNSAHHVRIEGFAVTSTTSTGIQIEGGSSNNVIQGNTIATSTGTLNLNISGTSSNDNQVIANTINVPKGILSTGIRNEGTRTIISQNKIFGTTSLYSYTGIYNTGSTTKVNNNMVVANAMIIGILLASGSGNEVYFNSVRQIATSSSATYGIYHAESSGTTNIKDNVITIGNATGTSYALYLAGSVNPVSNYNCIFRVDNGGITGRATNGNTYQTLSQWQSGTGHDLNSIDKDPKYLSTTDLHIRNPFLKAGTPITGITVDHDGQTRSNTPFIGADELPPLEPGTYSVDSHPSSTLEDVPLANNGIADWKSVVDAADYLTIGIKGPVTIEVRNGGAEGYSGMVSIGNIPRLVSATDQVIFQNTVGHYPVIKGTTNIVKIFGETDYITVRGFQLQDATQHGVIIEHGCDNNLIEGNRITNAGTSGNYAAIYLNPENNTAGANQNTIRNNFITGDFDGIFVLWGTGNVVEGNTLTGVTGHRITAGWSANTLIQRNVISIPDGGETGIRVVGTASGTKIYNNMIYGTTSSGNLATVGIYVVEFFGAPTSTQVYFNSIRLTATGSITGHAAIKHQTTGSSNSYKNNVISIQETGTGTIYGFYIYSGTPSSADYDNYYRVSTANTFTGFNGANRATLSDWQTASGFDLNGKDVDPKFTSPDDLHISGTSGILNSGTVISEVSTDIDNETRSSTPDMGADEYQGPVTATPNKPAFFSIGFSNQLKFVINDTVGLVSYAAKIQSTTPNSPVFYVQTDGSIATSKIFQSFASWGGLSGAIIKGLEQQTVYKLTIIGKDSAGNESLPSEPAYAMTHSANDPDQDALTTAFEQSFGSNPNFRDTDNDNLTDAEELLRGTNPNKADSDNDGVSDFDEFYVKKTDPLKADTDNDGVNDKDDPFPLDPTQGGIAGFDNIAPAIVTINPPQDLLGAPVTQKVTVVWTEDIMSSSVVYGTNLKVINVTTSGLVSGSVTVTKNKIEFTPTGNLPNGTTFETHVLSPTGTRIKDLQGNEFTGSRIVTWKTVGSPHFRPADDPFTVTGTMERLQMKEGGNLV